MVRKSPVEHDLPGLRLLIIRHGQAEPRAATGREEDRALTALGHHQAAWLADHLRAEHIVPALILHSPLRRAVETARALHPALAAPLQPAAALALDEPLAGVRHLIDTYRGMGTLALVGHNPQLSHLAGTLVPDLDAADVDLRTGEALILDIAPGLSLDKAMLTDRLRADDEPVMD